MRLFWRTRNQLMHARVRDQGRRIVVGCAHTRGEQLVPGLGQRAFLDEVGSRLVKRPAREPLVLAGEAVRVICVDAEDVESGLARPAVQTTAARVVDTAGDAARTCRRGRSLRVRSY